jgi:BirA family transcriptional regulator, biotin operon repressor / biotin---[acetyl-CoA-carboxylase] ligase
LLRPDLRPQETTQLTSPRHRPAPRDCQSETGLEAGNQMAERHFDRRQKSRGHFDRMSAELDRVKHVILGIGVDVNLGGEFPPELRKLATSLKIETGGRFRARNWPWPFCANWILITRGLRGQIRRRRR